MDLKELYRDVILDHNRQPAQLRTPRGQPTPTPRATTRCAATGCTVSLRLNGDRIEDIRFEGKGCAISTASASLMTEAVKGKDRAAVRALFEQVHTLLTQPGCRRPRPRSASSPRSRACASSRRA